MCDMSHSKVRRRNGENNNSGARETGFHCEEHVYVAQMCVSHVIHVFVW